MLSRRIFLLSAIILVYGVLHLITLPIFPFVHSDEAWLASLTRSMIVNRSPAAVEESFRLIPRYPHALKTLFHFIQSPFLGISFTPFAARLPSLLAGGVALVLLVTITGDLGIGPPFRYLPALLLAVDPQFWYSAHLGRQEMLLLALALLSLSAQIRKRPPVLVAMPMAAAVFVHPNAFVVAIPLLISCGAGLFSRRKSLRSRGIRDLCIVAAVLAGTAAIALGMSLLMDRGFLGHYRTFGAEVGVGDSFLEKWIKLPRFLAKMAGREAGTYYLPPVRRILVLFAVSFGITLVSIPFVPPKRRKTAAVLLLFPVGILLGTAMVGKFGPPTLVFLFPYGYLLVGNSFSWLSTLPRRRVPAILARHFTRIVAVILVFWISWVTAGELLAAGKTESYSDYRAHLERAVGPEGRVLANFNTAFVFDYDRLVIWRDLAGLPRNSGGLEAFLDDHDVRWIVVPEEISRIYRDRPVWNALYGNPRWYPELIALLRNRGHRVARFPSPTYGMRIVPYREQREWETSVWYLDPVP